MPTSKKIEQILDVLARVRAAQPTSPDAVSKARRAATKAIARDREIDERSVADKCWRGLWQKKNENFHINDFDGLIWQWLSGNDAPLRQRCLSASSTEEDRDAVEIFLSNGVTPTEPTSQEEGKLTGAVIVDHVHASLLAEGLDFSKEQVADFYLAVRTKPFVLLAGISGTGKSILARRFADACDFPAPMIPVRPDWSDPSELIGYRDLEGAFVPGKLLPHLVEAIENHTRPFFVVLDEMNLARVEHYFADLLSILETRCYKGDRIETDPLDLDIDTNTRLRCSEGLASRIRAVIEGPGLSIPSNLCFIGTVNMDESTHPFSKKVLDRAMTLEFVEVNLRVVPKRQARPEPLRASDGDLDAPHLSLADVYEGSESRFEDAISLLVELNEILASASFQVGYRTRDEICLYLHHNAVQGLLNQSTALDLAIYHKVLPRLQGGEEIRDLLGDVRLKLAARELPRCLSKIDEMQSRLERAGFTAFWS